jgi:hypothetical protein
LAGAAGQLPGLIALEKSKGPTLKKLCNVKNVLFIWKFSEAKKA